MHWIAALAAEPTSRATLGLASRRVAALRCFESPAALLAGVSEQTPDAVILLLRVESADAVVSLVRTLRTRHRRLPLVGYCRVSTTSGRLIVTSIRAGLNALAFEGVDDLGAVLASVVAEGHDDSARMAILERLGALIPATFRPVVGDCIRLARTPLRVTVLAERHGMHRATLAAACRAAHMCPPNHLIMWGKLVVASRLMDAEHGGIERIAHTVALSSGAALSSAFQRYVGQRPSVLLESNAFDLVTQAFASDLTAQTAGTAVGAFDEEPCGATAGRVR